MCANLSDQSIVFCHESVGVIPKPEKQVREGARSARLDFVNEDVATLEVKFVLTVNWGGSSGDNHCLQNYGDN